METTRHFVSTIFLVHENKTAVHDHKKLDYYLPPGGHIDRDELPSEAAEREVKEETGIDVHVDGQTGDLGGSQWSHEIKSPQYLLLDNVVMAENDEPAHQHVNLVYFAYTDDTEINPMDSEVSSEHWHWVSKEELTNQTHDLEIETMTKKIAIKAIEYYQD